jgi:hypothetical protein
MLTTLLLSIVGMGLFAFFMSLGLIFRGKEIKGTCASKTTLLYGEGAVCSVCGQVPGSCDTEDSPEKAPQATA